MYNNHKPYELKLQPSSYKANYWDEVKVAFEGNEYATTQFMEKLVKTHVKRISATTYQVLSTGEIKEYETMSDIAKKMAKRVALNRTFKELRGLIRTNFVSEDHPKKNAQLFITLTYAENMEDEKRLYADFNLFMKNLSYAFKDHEFSYIAVMEPQGRGAWHVHLLLKSLNHDWLWIDKEEITRIWRHGMTTTARLKSNDVGAYYTAYFTGLIAETSGEEQTGEDVLRDEELTELFGKLTGDDESLKKAHIKGARLGMYPKGMKLYRTSRNVTKPDKDKLYLFEIEDEYEKIYEKSVDVQKIHLTGENAGEVEVLNRIHNATYKKKK